MKVQQIHTHLPYTVFTLVGAAAVYRFYLSLDGWEIAFIIIVGLLLAFVAAMFFQEYMSVEGRDRRKRIETIKDLPSELISNSDKTVMMGLEHDLQIPIYLSDSVRSRHVHILGATGSGKTESVILNFIKQDVKRGLGCIILDAKGDMSFLRVLRDCVPKEKLKVFDLSSDNGLGYNPLVLGSPLESAQRLFSSLTWSEEYYASKAQSALQSIFQYHAEIHKQNPTLAEINQYLATPKSFLAVAYTDAASDRIAEKEFLEISGLRDQIKMLCIGHLQKKLSPEEEKNIPLETASQGAVIYFRLQSLMSPQIASIIGKLLINHLSFLAGSKHRAETVDKNRKLTPVYLDEFAAFACEEFTSLISMARSADFALHFSHQSIGDVAEVSKGFLNQITDNSATKIVLRISDPDSAEFFARSFGTRLVQKLTQRVTNTKENDQAEVIGEGSQREAHQFRSSPNLFKTLPTGMGSVLIAHGIDTKEGGSSVFKIKFPKL